MTKPQRIRDPLHNLIEFNTSEFERVIWKVIQTKPFQRLRRIKQLGFSDLTFPGATHTRFAHSIGVFHTARQLMKIVQEKLGTDKYSDSKASVALAAALVHDLGHGMFSHTFESLGKKLDLKMARHEEVSKQIILNNEVAEVLKELGSGFPRDVSTLISKGTPSDLYDAVVSSQFDADRLDYMQRDRLMTGVQNSGIDFAWLIKNLEIGEVPSGVDDSSLGNIETFILSPKAIYAAETYVLSLFQLYPTVYYHKTTRGAEKMFSFLMLRVLKLIRDNQTAKTGLPQNHPIVKFGNDSDSLENALALDDNVSGDHYG
ncbi:MAG: HD domain-containing protein [Synechococcaceae cyanobacterium SM2_3_2]|nr:HD domain-containing protein [Synechococcaceae cyanobacterium SM2_3_2]